MVNRKGQGRKEQGRFWFTFGEWPIDIDEKGCVRKGWTVSWKGFVDDKGRTREKTGRSGV